MFLNLIIFVSGANILDKLYQGDIKLSPVSLADHFSESFITQILITDFQQQKETDKTKTDKQINYYTDHQAGFFFSENFRFKQKIIKCVISYPLKHLGSFGPKPDFSCENGEGGGDMP